MVGFTIPDNDVAAFPLQSQIFELDIEIMAGDAGWVVAGCEVTAQGSPDMSVHVAAGVARPRGLPNVLVAADDLAIDAAHATLWRIDLISASTAGVLTYTAGTAAIVTAVKPPARPADHVGLAFVLVPPAATEISSDLIIDKRNLSDPGVLRYLDHGNTGASEDIDFSAADVQRIVLNAATVTLSTSGWPVAGTPGIVRVYVEQDGTGGRLLDYSGEIDWGDPGPPILQTTPGAVDIIDLQTIDGGTNVLASMPNRPGATGSAGADGADGISGGAVSIPYTFSTTTTDADPGNGQLRLSNATQNASTVIRADLLASDGTDWSAVLATLADADNVVKGHLRLFKTADPTKWLLFTVSAVATPSGYVNITAANVGSSAASPFSDSDPITLDFTRSGDQGSTVGSGTLTTIEEEDGTPTDSAVTKLVVPNGLLSFVGHVAHLAAPLAHRCTVYASGNVTVNNSMVPFDSEIVDSDGFHDNSTNNSRITIPTGLDGTYIFTFNFYDLTGAAMFKFYKNAAQIPGGGVYGDAAGKARSSTTILDLAAGDYVEVFAETGGSHSILGGSTDGVAITFRCVRVTG